MQSTQPSPISPPAPPPKAPSELPHGLIRPPKPVLDRIEQERAKHPPQAFAKHEERLRNDWTIDYYFDSLCLEVAYRSTPEGPVVLAVGPEELVAWRKATALDEQIATRIYLGYP